MQAVASERQFVLEIEIEIITTWSWIKSVQIGSRAGGIGETEGKVAMGSGERAGQ
jgi:hypothetical protein